MPLYEFQCPACGTRFEKRVRATTAQERIAYPACRNMQVERQFSPVALVGKSSCAPQRGGG